MSVTSQGLTDQEQLELEQVRSKFDAGNKTEALDKIFANITRSAVEKDQGGIQVKIAAAVRAIILQGKNGKPIDPSDF